MPEPPAAAPDLLVSVVVPTYDRPGRLGRLLDGLRAQTLGTDRFEVLVVDDASGPETTERLNIERATGTLRLTHLRQPFNRGPAAARNTGWRHASAPLVAFTDDDCVPTPEWLEALVAAAADDPGAIVQGPTAPDPTELAGSLVLARTTSNTTLGPSFETCNIAYPVTALRSLGGFDERWSVGEDSDLAWRALETGHRTVFAAGALVHHAVERRTALETLRGATRWAGAAHVFADHPAARQILYRRIFWNEWHYLLVRSAVALAAPAWVRRPLLAGHLTALQRRRRSLGGGPWATPFLLAVDLIETVAMVGGAIRQRTPLL